MILTERLWLRSCLSTFFSKLILYINFYAYIHALFLISQSMKKILLYSQQIAVISDAIMLTKHETPTKLTLMLRHNGKAQLSSIMSYQNSGKITCRVRESSNFLVGIK